MTDSSTSPMAIVVIMILAIGTIGGGTFSYIQAQEISNLEDENMRLQIEVDNLEDNLTNLENGYDELMNDYDELMNNYGNLYDDYSQLLEDYDNLTECYEDLLQNYTSLFADYDALRTAFEDPLENPVIPTIAEVTAWLDIDDTDASEYVDGVWECGDFAAMLMTRAKAMNWRMRIVVVHYSYDGDLGYGSYIDVYGSGGHAFNLIECEDGIWYIEPQSDGHWYFTNSGNRVLMSIHHYYTFSSGNSIWDGHTIWTNFYGYFG